MLARVAVLLNPLLRCLGLLICVAGWSVSLAQAAAPTTITLSTSTPTFPMASGWLTITATVKGAAPTGIVTLKEGASSLDGRWLSGGVATLNIDPRVLGEHRYFGEYGGDANNAASTSAEIRIIVAKANTSVALSASKPVISVNVPLTLSVRVSGALGSGVVSFMDGPTLLKTVTPAYGTASLETAFTTTGTHALTAIYSGDAQSNPSTSATVNLNVIQPQSTFEYDANGNLTRYTDPLGSATEHRYDSLGRLSTTYEPNPTPGATSTQGTISYAYDALGQLKRLTDPRSLATTYTTDGLGNTTEQVSPDTGTTRFTYDEAGNLKTRTDARGKITYFFWDALNRPQQIDFGDARIDYLFDTATLGRGRLGEVRTVPANQGADTRLIWEYDGLGRITRRDQQIAVGNAASLVSLSQRYGWNALTDTLDTLTLPSGRVLGYRYRADGVLTQIDLDGQPLIADIRFNAFGPLASYSAFSRQYSRRYDLNGRLTTLPLGDLQRKLAWDAASRLVQQDDVPTAGATESRRFGYDRLDRLLSQDVDASPSATNTQQFRYSWDLAGNRSTYSYKDGTGSWTYTHSTPSSSNRLDSVTGSTGKLSYTYDEAGNPKGDGDKTYTWRASGWLDSLTRNGLTTRYAYNGFAQRVAKLSGSTPNTSADTRLYTYDEAGHLLGEYTASGQLIQEHVWLGDTPIALIDAQGVKLVFADQLDTPRRITDTTGKALWKWNGEAFGLTLPNEDADGDGKALTYNLRFPGQVFDKESALHYNWHRYYDPATGRYISSDPIGLEGGVNTYGYVGGSPLIFFDFDGFSRADINIMIRQLHHEFPEWAPSGSWKFGTPSSENIAETDRLGNMTFPSEWAEKGCLSPSEYYKRIAMVFHEGMHSSGSVWELLTSSNDDDAPLHSSIWKRQAWEFGLQRPSDRRPEPRMWGKPRKRPVDADAMYRNYLEQNPECTCQK
ncbi:MAG: Ig-like domain repeat protein [Uliginosibacterium sp.]|nr:Ig-like domain repeat protein [Uliginosibacterium sp.]